MSKITRAAMKKIWTSLDDTHFTSAGFSVEFPDAGDKYIVITFLDDEDFFFNVEPPRNYNGYTVRYAPGNVVRVTEFRAENFDQCIRAIETWTANIRQEIIATHPLFSEFEQLRESVRQTIDQKFQDHTATFSPDEIVQLKHDLDQLAARFENLQDKNAITEQELAAVKKTVEALKADADHFPKKTWYRTAGNNLVKLVSSILGSEPGQKLLEDGARKLLELPDSQ